MDGLKSGDLSASTTVKDGTERLSIKNLILVLMIFPFSVIIMH